MKGYKVILVQTLGEGFISEQEVFDYLNENGYEQDENNLIEIIQQK